MSNILKHVKYVTHAHIQEADTPRSPPPLLLPCLPYFKALLLFSCGPRGSRTHGRNFSQQPDALSLGPTVGGVSKLPSNHIHAVTGGVPGHIWSSLLLTPHSTRIWGVGGGRLGWEEGVHFSSVDLCQESCLCSVTRSFPPPNTVEELELVLPLLNSKWQWRQGFTEPFFVSSLSAAQKPKKYISFLNWATRVPLPHSVKHDQSWCFRFVSSEVMKTHCRNVERPRSLLIIFPDLVWIYGLLRSFMSKQSQMTFFFPSLALKRVYLFGLGVFTQCEALDGITEVWGIWTAALFS